MNSDRVVLAEAMGTVESVRDNVAEVRWDTGARCPVPLAWLSPASGCAECGGPMEPERSTRKFCSNPCRLRAWRRNAKARSTPRIGEAENARESAEGNVREAA
jgi:endogenous inhibitor of DNA gyrase (YacG/DUF329 family)